MNETRPLLYSEWRQAHGNNRAAYDAYLRETRMGSDPVTAGIIDQLYGDHTPERTFTRDEVRDVLNRAVDLVLVLVVLDSNTIKTNDVVNLIINAAGYLLSHPSASLDEVILDCYANVKLEGYDFRSTELTWKDGAFALPEKGSPEWNAALVRKVLGWVE